MKALITPRNSPHQSETMEDAAADTMDNEQANVEHVSVAGFLQKIPHDQPWQLHNVIKFGNTVRNLAAAFCTEYHSVVDRSLGKVQAFPEPLVRRVYKFISPSLGWPQLVEEIHEQRERTDHEAELEVRETVQAYLQMLVTTAKESRVRSCARNLLGVVNRECAMLRELTKREAQAVPAPAPKDPTGLAEPEADKKAA